MPARLRLAVFRLYAGCASSHHYHAPPATRPGRGLERRFTIILVAAGQCCIQGGAELLDVYSCAG